MLADIEALVEGGARHITFGDPDFLNGPQHSRRVVAAMHERWPELTFDCTVKVEHILRHARRLAGVRRRRLPVRGQRLRDASTRRR